MSHQINQRLLALGVIITAIVSIIGVAQAVTPLEYGETISGSIDTSTEIDTYTFSADSNDTVTIRIDGPSGSNNLNPEIRLYAPNGTLLTSQWNYNNLEMQHTLPDNGEYKISVLDYNIEYTGSYNLFIQRLNNPSNTTQIGFGEMVSGSIDTSPEIDTYTFSADSNDTIIIRVDGPSASNDLNPEVRLYAPNGTLLTSQSSNNNIEMLHTLPDNGEYKISVLDYNIEYTGSYNLFIERLNNPSNTTPIGFGEMVSGSINSSPEIDTYTFSADSNDTVIIRVDGPSASNDLNPEIRLYAPNGTLLTSQWNYNNLEMQHTLPDNGEYKISVLDYNIEYTGSYNLFIQRLNNPSNTTPIGFGEMVSGSINSSPEIDTYTFSADSNDTVIIRVDGPSASNDLNPEIRLYAPNGTLLTSQWNYNNLEMQHTLPDNGEYKILVLDYNIEYTGSYNLFIERLNNPSNTTPIGFGEMVSGSINSSPEIDTYTFSADSNDTVIIRVDGPSASNDLNPEIRLYAPNGTLLMSQWSYNNLEMQHTLPDNGEYKISVLDYNIEYTGSYNLFIQRLNNPSNTTPIGFGEMVSGSIDTSPEIDTYTFSADSNDTVIIRVDGPSASNDLNPEIRLYAPNGTLLMSQWSYNNLEMQHTLPDNGEYKILVLDYNIEYTGSYNLFIERLNNPSNTTPIGFGEMVSGSIDTSPEIDTYTFSADSNDTVIIRVDGPSASNDLNPEIRLYAPNGTLLTSQWNYNNLEMQHTLPDNGEYKISVLDYNIEYTGSYNLFIQRLNNPSNTTPIGFVEMVSGSIDTSPEIDTYTFSADSNDTVIIRVDGPSASNDLNPEIRLYAPNGTLLMSQWSYNNLEMQHTLPDNGEYKISVLDYNIEYTGSYNLFIQRLNNPGLAPFVNFTYSPKNQVVNQVIIFNATASYDPDGIIINYEWDFGDGNITSTTEKIITHSYTLEGYYDVNLRIRDNSSTTNSTTKSVQVVPIGITIDLYTGWNLISLPLMPEETSIAFVLSPINGNYSLIWEYNASDTSDHWKKYDPGVPFGNDLTNMEPGNGYWILMTSDNTLPISGTVPESTDIVLKTGWNLIGYNSLDSQPVAETLSSISGNYSIVWAYNASDTTDHWKKYDPSVPFGNDLTIVEPGKGYWIMMTFDDYLET